MEYLFLSSINGGTFSFGNVFNVDENDVINNRDPADAVVVADVPFVNDVPVDLTFFL